MGESYLPHSVLHEKVLTLRNLCVRLVHRPKAKSWESYRPIKNHVLCDPFSRGWELLRTDFQPGRGRACSTVRPHTFHRVIRGYSHYHFPDKKSGRSSWERRGALAGFYGTSISPGTNNPGAFSRINTIFGSEMKHHVLHMCFLVLHYMY